MTSGVGEFRDIGQIGYFGVVVKNVFGVEISDRDFIVTMGPKNTYAEVTTQTIDAEKGIGVEGFLYRDDDRGSFSEDNGEMHERTTKFQDLGFTVQEKFDFGIGAPITRFFGPVELYDGGPQ